MEHPQSTVLAANDTLEELHADDRSNGYSDNELVETEYFHDLWLGAREYGGMWKWEYTGESLVDSDDSKKSSNNSKINKFKPAWVESYWEDDGEKCLNVYRRNLTESLFIGQPCNRTFGFVCESSPIGSEPKTMVVTHKGRKYALHNRLVTWTEAVASCRASGSYLAVITDLEEAWSIAAANITFHDLWLGGHLREYHWEWENTGQPLDFSPNVSTGYPPWIRVPQQPQHNCINLYSDSGRPYFVDRRCRELHGYVCEEAGSDENTSIVEYFGGHRYVFVNKHVTWSTAVESCRAMQGYLAVASDNDELRFIVNGTRDFHDVWIGGHMSNSHWEWDHTGQKLLTPSASPVTGSDIVNKLVPQWIRFPTRPVHDCLSVYRDNNNSAYLLDSRCNSQHTYVCEDVPVNQHKEMEIKQYKHRNYILVYERASWDEAVRVCHARGGYLAVPDDLEEARFLVSASADLHDVWVGGARKQYHPWEWTHTGRLIGAIIPWASQPRPAHDCVNLYRDRGSKPLLVARRCAQRFGFICEDTTDDDPVSQVIRFRGRNYFFSNQAETWETAVNICKSRGSYLAIVGDIDEADFIATVSPYFHDVWVGGSSVNGLWKWEHTGQTIPNKRPTKPLGKDGYPPWIGNTTRPGHDCLNVYRGADDTPSFIDRLCDEKHAYVCEEAPDTKNAESLQEFNGRIYKFYSRRVTWDHALEICKESGSYLAVVTEPDEAVFIARSGKDFHDLWVGGKLDYEKWEWDHTGQSISPHNSDPSVFPWWSREIPVVNNECLNIYRDDDSKPLFVDRHCSELKGFVCEEVGLLLAADTPSENQVLELNGNMYIFTPNKMIWSDAYDACMNNGSTLPVVLDSQTAIFLASAWSEAIVATPSVDA
ncbi:C-type mannose receptor 2-like [Anabrus simplex]|uniref:C-type mannose receptor 2-like n=1 Tax=Anabrus simplex TaxID=316456 RepID=UPI0035A3BBA9